MTITEKDVRSSSRHSTQVRRYHVWPMLQEQRTDAHTFHMLRLYCLIWGAPSPGVTWHVVFHDAGEGDAGDFQYGAKRRHPRLKDVSDEVEGAHLMLLLETDMVDGAGPPGVTDQEWVRAKACDLLEGLEHSLVDYAMGNRLAGPVVHAYSTGLASHRDRMDAKDDLAVTRYLSRPYHQKLWGIYEGDRT